MKLYKIKYSSLGDQIKYLSDILGFPQMQFELIKPYMEDCGINICVGDNYNLRFLANKEMIAEFWLIYPNEENYCVFDFVPV